MPKNHVAFFASAIFFLALSHPFQFSLFSITPQLQPQISNIFFSQRTPWHYSQSRESLDRDSSRLNVLPPSSRHCRTRWNDDARCFWRVCACAPTAEAVPAIASGRDRRSAPVCTPGSPACPWSAREDSARTPLSFQSGARRRRRRSPRLIRVIPV